MSTGHVFGLYCTILLCNSYYRASSGWCVYCTRHKGNRHVVQYWRAVVAMLLQEYSIFTTHAVRSSIINIYPRPTCHPSHAEPFMHFDCIETLHTCWGVALDMFLGDCCVTTCPEHTCSRRSWIFCMSWDNTPFYLTSHRTFCAFQSCRIC